MILAALDLATKCGVVLGPTDGAPAYWTVKLGKGDARFAKAASLVRELTESHNAGQVVVEEPFRNHGVRGSAGAMTFLLKLSGAAHAAAAMAGVEYREVAASTALKAVAGRVPRKRAERKALAMATCKLLGWHPASEDEADALILWEAARRQAASVKP